MTSTCFHRIVCSILVFIGFASGSAFASCSSSLSGTTATVTCTASSDNVSVGQYTTDGTNYFWFHFGSSGFGASSGDWDDGAAGTQSLAAGGTINFNFTGGGGNVFIGIQGTFAGFPYRPADALNGAVGITNLTGTATNVTFDATLSSTAHTWSIDDNAPATTTVGSLTFHDGGSNATAVTIITGTAADTVNVLSIYGNDPFVVHGNSGGDVANLGQAGVLTNIAGPISFDNSGSFTTLNLDDSADGTGRTATFTDDGTSGHVSGTGAALISWADSDTTNITLSMGTNNDTANVQAYAAAIGSLTIQGTSGADIVNIGNAGSVQSILTSVIVRNAGSFSTLTIDDSADSTGRVATITDDGTFGHAAGPAPATISWKDSDMTAINLNNGTGSDTVNLQGLTAAPLTIQGTDGSDAVNLGNAGSVQGINQNVSVFNTLFFTVLTIDDSTDGTARTANVNSGNAITGVTPAGTISWGVNDIFNVNLNMGTGADTVNVHAIDNALNIQGTSGADFVAITNTNSTAGILAPITVANSGAYTTIDVDDSAEAINRSGHFSATGLTGLTAYPVTWTQNDVNQVFAFFGSGDDVVHVASTPTNGVSGGPLTYISLGDGTNQMYINGAGLGAFSTDDFVGGNGNDLFDITSAVANSQNVTAVNIFGNNPTTFPGDQLDYFAAASSSGTTGTLTPADPNAKAISYNSIEFFDYNDEIFRDSFQ
jgi:hypothetical protein